MVRIWMAPGALRSIAKREVADCRKHGLDSPVLARAREVLHLLTQQDWRWIQMTAVRALMSAWFGRGQRENQKGAPGASPATYAHAYDTCIYVYTSTYIYIHIHIYIYTDVFCQY